ncbi:uncharacterized protein LOC116849016 [Odontomachus brunneus]|uniref:uncharacterized protein LOC116849016 n=1 Tax=Odontomachus brunneus TaxID=486640 RepID=UPI0013F1E4E7|nr:uncharacterized protein LOC116849016 [Odontomachus brunneus]
MATIDSASRLISLLCFIVVLTSSVIAVAGPDGTSSALPPLSQDPPSKSSSATIEEHPYSNVADDKKVPKDLASTSMMIEGGPILIPTTTQQQANTKIVVEPDIPDKSRERQNTPKARFAIPSVVPRKGVEEKKVKARKGVSQSSLDVEQANTSISQITAQENIKPIVEDTATIAPVHTDNQAETAKIDAPKLNVTNSRPNDNSDYHGANFSSIPISVNANTSHIEVTNDTTKSSPPPVEKKHIPKPKPTVTTVGKSETNESRLSSRNKSSPLGAPRKIDYIVPVIITIVTLPILGTGIFLLYRRGRDCWDKRHYRRMDFLIDGMYND